MPTSVISRRNLLSAGGAFGLATLAGRAVAQRPPKRMTMVVPFAAGGSADIMARLVGQRLGEILDGTTVIDNRGGAGGNIAAAYVAKSAPDGATLLWGTIATHSLNPLITKKPAYDPIKDFTAISKVATLPNVMLVSPNVAAGSVGEVIELLKAAPDKYSFASSGVGTPLHLSGELFKLLSGTSMQHVPYRGSGPALNDLIAGHVPIMFDTLASAAQHIESGAVKAIAVTTRERAPRFAKVPTMEEAGLKGYETYAWHGIFGPPGMADPLAAACSEAVQRSLSAPDIRSRMEDLGATIEVSTPAGLAEHVHAELAKWGPIIKEAGVSID